MEVSFVIWSHSPGSNPIYYGMPLVEISFRKKGIYFHDFFIDSVKVKNLGIQLSNDLIKSDIFLLSSL